jgi:hypothetical protein
VNRVCADAVMRPNAMKRVAATATAPLAVDRLEDPETERNGIVGGTSR